MVLFYSEILLFEIILSFEISIRKWFIIFQLCNLKMCFFITNSSAVLLFFFSIRVFFHGHWQLTGQQGKGGDLFFPTLPLPPAHEHSDIYLQLCEWDDYHIFLIALLVFTRLQLHEIYHHTELPFDWLMMWSFFVCLLNDLILGFCYSNLDTGNRWTRARIDYHPFITSEPTNQVC